VVITSGHRCPTHNLYVDPSKKNRVSKHLMGAEVDFYVEEMEYEPLTVIGILEEFLKERSAFKEVIITYHPIEEKRNSDNQHGFPYITIEVKYDREKKQPVHFSWHQGYNGFHRSS